MSGSSINYLLIAFLAALLIGVIKGYRKGFIRIMVSLAGLIVVILIVTKISPYLSEYLIENTNVYENVRQKIVTAYNEDKGEQTPAGEEGSINPSITGIDIESLDLPEILASALTAQSGEEIYDDLSETIFSEYVSGYLARLAIKAGCFCGLFIALAIAMICLFAAIKVLEKIPVLRTFNRLMGMLAGGGMVILITWVFFIAILVFFYDSMGKWMLTGVKQSVILTYLFNNNMIFKILMK